MHGRHHVVVAGFPVRFETSFLVVGGILLFFFRELGIAAIVILGGSILVHELGHAFMFRKFGCSAEISIHMFGGSATSYDAHGLSNKEHVLVALAGPAAAFLLLGAPALWYNAFTTVTPLVEIVLNVLIWFNVYWGLVNLLPVWPLDGGRILYYGANHVTGRDQWPMVRAVTIVLCGIGAVFAYLAGFIFGAAMAAMFGFQAYQGTSPGSTSMKSPIRGAASSANRFAAQPTKARGSSGDAALRDACRRVASGRSDLAAEPLSVLTKSRRHRARAGELVFWMHVLDGDGDEARTQLADLDNASVDLASALELAEHPETASLSDMVQRIGSESTIEAIGPMLVFVNRCGRLRELIGLVADATTMDRLREVERLTLDFGLSDEQVIVSSILISRAAALDPNDG